MAARVHPVVLLLVAAIFLYWLVQDPIGAANMINRLFQWIIDLLQLLANRIVQFLNAF